MFIPYLKLATKIKLLKFFAWIRNLISMETKQFIANGQEFPMLGYEFSQGQ